METVGYPLPRDRMSGGDGDDAIRGGKGNDVIRGGLNRGAGLAPGLSV